MTWTKIEMVQSISIQSGKTLFYIGTSTAVIVWIALRYEVQDDGI